MRPYYLSYVQGGIKRPSAYLEGVAELAAVNITRSILVHELKAKFELGMLFLGQFRSHSLDNAHVSR